MNCKKLILPLLFIFLYTSAIGQPPSCQPNMDFEYGNLSNWVFFNGLAAAGTPYTVLTLSPSPPVSGREDLTSGVTLDPYGLFPVVGAGSYSCKLGHDTINYCAEMARYQIHVPPGVSYSIYYHYAVVLEDGGHPASGQPRFEVSAYDSVTGLPIACAHFNYITSSSLPGFKLSKTGFSVYYKPWSLGSMNLTAYGGKTVTIDFIAADCGFGGHFGYGYLDMACGLFAITNVSCNSSNTILTAPPGYAKYDWYDSSTFTILYGSADTITIPTPGVPTTYAVILTPYPGYGCPDTLYTTVRPTMLAVKPSHDTTVCIGSSVSLTTRATDIALPLTYAWSGGPGSISCGTCDPTTVTPALGLNKYIYTVTDAAGCTLTDTIRITAIGVIPLVSSTNVSCYGYKDGTANALPTSGVPPFTYSWNSIPVQITAAATGLAAGTYTVSISDKTGCTSKTAVTITEPPPTIIAIDGFSDPTHCNAKDGSITLRGLIPLTSFKISYRFNGVPQTVTLLASGAGKVVLTGLSAGTYDLITVIGTLCPYNVVGPVVLKDPPKPPPPPAIPQEYCQFFTPRQLVATGTDLLWYDGSPVGTPIAPTPGTSIPGKTFYFVTQTVLGCVSDSTMDSVIVNPKPAPPVTADTTYCQFTPSAVITASGNDTLKWYMANTGGLQIVPVPVPSTDIPGSFTWYVDQTTIHHCVSDRTPIKVTVLYKPNFYITPERPLVCQYDSIWLSYTGPSLVDPAYVWTIPNGESYSSKINTGIGVSLASDSMIYVRFDTVTQNNYVKLFVSDYNGMCSFDTFVRIPIIPHPTATAFSKADVCVGDTVGLALSNKSDNASVFTWMIDHVPMGTTTALNIIAHNENSGGPFSISWNASGRHVIEVFSATDEGCKAPPTVDTIFVHTIPDASFKYTTKNGPLCLEDSIMFIANTNDYNYSYVWSPAHFFQNINKGVTWGKVEQSKSIISLLVTDPFGCPASTSQEIDPSSCCSVNFPNAFTPNGDHKNDVFRPIYVGYHRFHIFRIANRWGQTVFESTNSNMQWDGNYNGVPQDIGVYFYYLKYDCGGNTIEQTGDVTLVR